MGQPKFKKINSSIIQIGFIGAIFLQLGCTTAQSKREVFTFSAFAAGALIGSQVAPDGERPELHSIYWAGVSGTVGSIVANRIYNEEEHLKLKDLEITSLKSQLDLMQSSKEVLVRNGKGDLAVEDQRLKDQNVKWKLYKIDKWIPESEHRLIHQDFILEVEK